MDLLQRLGKEFIFFDGGTGTILQEKGLGAGELPEIWNITHRENIVNLHRSYLKAGADVIKTNTFGANRLKFPAKTEAEGYTLEQIITAALENARTAVTSHLGKQKPYIALDLGPTGKLLKPMGDLDFDEAYDIYREVVQLGVQNGADLILIETMSDTYEAKAAVLAAKENSDLPVFVTMIFGENGKLLTGGTPAAAVAMLEGLGVDALGLNCGLGPVQMEPFFDAVLEYASIPVIVNPNAGLPRSENGKTVFDVGPEEFAREMTKMARKGAWVLGGCCGTTPDHIAALRNTCEGMTPAKRTPVERTLVSSYSQAVEIGRKCVLIGERINPTGKAKFKQALRDNNVEYILQEGLNQEACGAHILDVNVGLPEIDEPSMMLRVMTELQSIIDLPLQIDTSDPVTMENTLRHYNGKAMINSVNGKQEVMEQIFPLVKKYGGVVVALLLDERGIPETAEERLEIAKKITDKAAQYGIDRKELVFDGLCMTISSDSRSALVTLETLRRIRDELHGKSILGVSNISFGLPLREIINTNFFTMALMSGLNAAIINPNLDGMMRSYYGYMALANEDPQCAAYIERYAPVAAAQKNAVRTEPTVLSASGGGKSGSKSVQAGGDARSLGVCIEKGLKEAAQNMTKQLLETRDALTIINEEMIPALDHVGKGFEKGTVFLPQLLMSAEAAKGAFEIIKQKMESSGQVQEKKGKIILATVKGDIHDIGKNIVKVLLENYSYEVIDLGKDVPPEVIVETAVEKNVPLIGLSALMTTTVVNMEATIKLLREKAPEKKVVVGGAVLTQEYADSIGADCYAKDAMATVHYAEQVFQHGQQ